MPGGMMAIGIPEYRLPREALQAEIARILELGVELRLDSAMGRDYSLGDLEAQGFRAIFLATGASRSRRLGVPGDDLPGVIPATLFLKQVNLGESPRLAGAVVVVGGGSTAMDAARSAIRSGASSVTVLYRRARADMPAQSEEIEAAEREGVVIRDMVTVTGVVGERSVTAVRVQRQRPTGQVSGGRPLYAPVPGADEELAVTSILVAVGEEPDPSILPEGAGIEVSAFAGIAADRRTLATGRAGVFAGGDVVSGPKTIIDAVAAGRRAAASVHEYLAGRARRRRRDHGRGPVPHTARSLAAAGHRDACPRAPTAAGLRRGLVPGHAGRFRGGRPRVPRPAVASAAMRWLAAARWTWWPDVGPRTTEGVASPPPPVVPAVDATTTATRSRIMTPDQVSGFFDAGESFVEGTIAALLVAFWIIVVAVQLARPYMLRNLQKFTLRLGADLWWIIYVGLREILIVSLFLGGFIFLYPDVVAGNPLPITGGLATVCAFLVLYLKLVSKGEADARSYRIETLLLGLGATLYVVPYVLGVQVMTVDGAQGLVEHLGQRAQHRCRPAAVLPVGRPHRHHRPDGRHLQLPCGLRWEAARRADRGDRGMTMSADDFTTALVTNGQAWLTLSIAAILPMLWGFALVTPLQPAVHHPVPAVTDAPLRQRRLVAGLRPHARRDAGHHAGTQPDVLLPRPLHRTGPAPHGTPRHGRPAVGADRQVPARLGR